MLHVTAIDDRRGTKIEYWLEPDWNADKSFREFMSLWATRSSSHFLNATSTEVPLDAAQ